MNEINITRDNFKDKVINADKPVLVDFWADWCGPCKMASPIINEIANEYCNEISVCKINIDEEPELADKFYVASIPTFILFRNGKVVDSLTGFCPKEEIINLFR